MVKAHVTPANRIDYSTHVASDFSTGSYYLVVNIQDTLNQKCSAVVIENNELRFLLKEQFQSDESYTKYISNLLKNNDTLNVSGAFASGLRQNLVDINDTSIKSKVRLGKQEFILSFFKPIKNNYYVACFDNDREKNLIIYELIKNWSVYVTRDDESGCALIVPAPQISDFKK